MTKSKKERYLVTIAGWLPFHDPPNETATVVVETEDPVAWYMDRPTISTRGSFTPHALIGFWKIPTTWPKIKAMYR